MEFTDRILSCGYTGAVSFEKKEEIVRYMTFYCRLLVLIFNSDTHFFLQLSLYYSSVVLHSTVRLLPMLQQIASGLKLYDLLSLVQQETDICRQLFVPGSFCKVNINTTQ